MAIDIKKLDKRTNKMQFTYAGETMTVEYKPSAIMKPEYVEALDGIQDADEALVYQLKTAIVDWELVDEEGSKLEPSVELVRMVERPFWISLFRAINEDIRGRIEAKKA